MTRNRIRWALLAAGSLLVGGLVYGTWSIARADLPQSTATIIYKPDFEEWAYLYLLAAYRDSSGTTHFVSVGRTTINGRLRFKIIGTYSNSPAGQAWYEHFGSKIRGSIEIDCKRWTADGFPISLDDFQIDISAAQAKTPG